MKSLSFCYPLLPLTVLAGGLLVPAALAQGTAFSYQGRLDTDAGKPANGLYDFQFRLYDVAAGGSPMAGPIPVTQYTVVDGLFSTTLDFGNQFPGAPRWLELAVRTNGAAAFTTLAPRQAVSPTPYAITAGNVTGAVPAGQLSGSVADARLSPNVALRNGGNTFTGNQIISSGNVGIGTATPAAPLHVNGDLLRVEGAGGQAAYLGADTAGFDIEVGSLNPSIQQVALWNAASGNFMSLFANYGTFSGLQVINTDSRLRLNATAAGSYATAEYRTDGREWHTGVGGSASGALASKFYLYDATAGRARLVADPNGYLGIGTENPDMPLSIVGVGGANEWLSFKSADQVSRWHLNNRNGGLNFAQTGLADGRLFLGATGRVGIGTDVPQTRLHVYGPENPAVVRVQSAQGPGFGRLEFYSDPINSANEWRPAYIQSVDHGGFTGGMRFVCNVPGVKFGETEAMRLVAGRVGIGTGTATPTSRVQVIAETTGGDAINATCSTGSTAVYGVNTSGGGFGVTGVASGTGIAVLGSNPDPAGHAGYFTGHVKVTGTTTTGVLTITGGADLAEPFKMSDRDLPKGSVVVIDEENPGHLKLSDGAYDKRVAGIISGAGGVHPGISLSQQGVLEGDQNVALSGRVYVRADASAGAIKPGDLLTTSAVPGHAMKVSDGARAQGAILGKAMTGLKDGQGLVLVLVTLQ